MENKVHGIHYRLVFTGIGTLVLLVLLIVAVWGTIIGLDLVGFSLRGVAISFITLIGVGLAFVFLLQAFRDIRQGLTTDAGTVNRKGVSRKREYFIGRKTEHSIGVTCDVGVTREPFEDTQEFQALKDDQGLEVAQEMSEFYSPADREFKVSREIYDWLSPEDKVIVTYWPRTKILARIDKTGPRLRQKGAYL